MPTSESSPDHLGVHDRSAFRKWISTMTGNESTNPVGRLFKRILNIGLFVPRKIIRKKRRSDTQKFYNSHQNDINTLLDMAQDETSKEVIRTQLAFIKDYDYSNEKGYLEKVGLLQKHIELLDSNEYFPTGIIELSDDEVFVDGGGFNGDTVDEFFKRSGGSFEHIYSFEPDKKNFTDLQQTIAKLHPKKGQISAHPQGLYSENKTLRFNQKGIGSSISEDGNDSIDVVMLDSFLNDEQKSKVSFIKLDVEGAELEALAGMEQVIRQNKPKLAICVYHKTEHFWEVPFLIKKYNPEYRIYFRQHALSRLETVCYAI